MLGLLLYAEVIVLSKVGYKTYSPLNLVNYLRKLQRQSIGEAHKL